MRYCIVVILECCHGTQASWRVGSQVVAQKELFPSWSSPFHHVSALFLFPSIDPSSAPQAPYWAEIESCQPRAEDPSSPLAFSLTLQDLRWRTSLDTARDRESSWSNELLLRLYKHGVQEPAILGAYDGLCKRSPDRCFYVVRSCS